MTSPFAIDHYQSNPLMVVISGLSGAGKDTVIHRMKERKLPFHFVVTATTRPPRPGEVHGRDYLFVSHQEFIRMLEHGDLLEHALVYQDYKGVPREQVRQAFASGQDVVLRLDVQGAARIRQLFPEALLIFLTTQDFEEMIQRLKARRTESPNDLQLRVDAARQEIGRLPEFDYVVVNREGHLDETVDTILAIIHAEHHRVRPRRVTL